MQMGQAHKRQQIRLSGEKSSPVGGDGGLRLGAELYTGPGGARSGGFAAGTLRGFAPAGVPSGTQCAPALRFPTAPAYPASPPRSPRARLLRRKEKNVGNG